MINELIVGKMNKSSSICLVEHPHCLVFCYLFLRSCYCLLDGNNGGPIKLKICLILVQSVAFFYVKNKLTVTLLPENSR